MVIQHCMQLYGMDTVEQFSCLLHLELMYTFWTRLYIHTQYLLTYRLKCWQSIDGCSSLISILVYAAASMHDDVHIENSPLRGNSFPLLSFELVRVIPNLASIQPMLTGWPAQINKLVALTDLASPILLVTVHSTCCFFPSGGWNHCTYL